MESVELIQGGHHFRPALNQVRHKVAADNERLATSVLAEFGDRDRNKS